VAQARGRVADPLGVGVGPLTRLDTIEKVAHVRRGVSAALAFGNQPVFFRVRSPASRADEDAASIPKQEGSFVASATESLFR